MTTNAGTARQLAALGRGNLAGTRELRLAGGLAEFPRDLFGLADSLEILDLGAGSLTHLPQDLGDRKSTRLNSSHSQQSRMPSSA